VASELVGIVAARAAEAPATVAEEGTQSQPAFRPAPSA